MAERTHVTDQDTYEPSGDTVTISNLQLPHGIIAPDVWGKAKLQPAVISVSLVLRQNFTSAARNDTLDQSTIHYGELAKRIRAGCVTDQNSVTSMLAVVEGVVSEMGMRADGSSRLSRAIVEIELQKATMFGSSIKIVHTDSYHKDGRPRPIVQVFKLHDMGLMAVIGVNAQERTAKQPLKVNLELTFDCVRPGTDTYHDASVFTVERRLAEIIQNSSFETLESLAEFAISRLQDDLLEKHIACSIVALSLAKPKAVTFADSAGVQVLRRMPTVKTGGATGSAAIDELVQNPALPKLNIIKPYVSA